MTPYEADVAKETPRSPIQPRRVTPIDPRPAPVKTTAEKAAITAAAPKEIDPRQANATVATNMVNADAPAMILIGTGIMLGLNKSPTVSENEAILLPFFIYK